MTDDSYHMPICIGIGIGISIGKIFSSVLGIESIRRKWYRSTFTHDSHYLLFVILDYPHKNLYFMHVTSIEHPS